MPSVTGIPNETAGLAPVALYVHFPFCLSLCPYCDFVVYAGSAARGPASRVEATVAALHRELDLRADEHDGRLGPPGPRRPALDSLYLGGGTPSLLEPGQVAGLIEHVAARMGLARDAEVTLEANPGPDERGDLAGFRAAGVTRLSIGAQSLEAGLLRRIGRRHGPDDVADALGEARRAGFASVGLDLLVDLPGQSVADWRATLARALDLGPDHLSVYALTLDDPEAEGLTGPGGDHLPLRAGARRWRERALPMQDEDRAAEMEVLTDEMTRAAGMERYEIANLARPGHRSRHNLAYWRRLPYEALGPGAHAFDGSLTRRWNAARLDRYLAALAGHPPMLPPGGHETLTPDAAIAEEAILGLRLCEGIGAPLALHPLVAPALTWGRRHALVEEYGGAEREGREGAEREAPRTRLTARGRLLANEVFGRIVADPG